MKYIIDRYLRLENDAGFKARVDIVNILIKEGYKYIDIDYNNNNKIKKIMAFINIVFMKIENGSEVIIQYPLNKLVLNIILKKVKLKKCNTTCIIHDIDTLRRLSDTNDIEIKNEIKVLNKFNNVISHNKYMSNWLTEKGLTTRIYNLNLFDYLSESNSNTEIKVEKYSIAYATGVLGSEKSKFLYELIDKTNCNYNILLYGGIEELLKEKIKNRNYINYKGSLPGDLIAKTISGSFGLVWDSTRVDDCTGDFGEYTKYNNPHKLSMYIAADMPVIVWSKSAIADFVKENNIGLCIDNICNIDEVLFKLSYDEYLNIKSNVKLFSKKVRNGENIKYIINEMRGIQS